MELSVWQTEWFLWCTVAFVPFQVYDLYKKENRKWGDFILLGILVIFVLLFVLGRILGDYEPHGLYFIGGMPTIYVLGGLTYLATLYEAVTARTKRSCINVGMLTIAIIVYCILMFCN